MRILNTVSEVKAKIREWKSEGLSIGFVPTMGYLHEGHESLIKRARFENDKVVVSIFVNPIQFGVNEDLSNYPRDLKSDSELCKRNDVDIIFAPTDSEMYSNKFSTFIDINGLGDNLCGNSRPGHFSGVCTVVTKLFNIVNPTKAYFGEKDAQQLAIIKRVVEDLNMDVEVVGCPIIREDDGLAKSSRNTYLTDEGRVAATILNKSLLGAKELLSNGERNSNKIKNFILDKINTEPLAKVDYIGIVDALTMKDIDAIKDDTLIAIAVYVGKSRLIDNFTFKI